MDEIFSLKNKKIWIAGHKGMVGSALCRRLESEKCDIIVAQKSELDLTRQEKTEKWIAKNKPDIVIMAAAKAGGIIANNNAQADFLYDNLSMAQNVIHGSYKAGVNKLLYLGSSCIYPKNITQPIKEEYLLSGKLEPTNEGYAIAKIAGLKLCEKYKQQYGCNFISAMPCNLYGVNDRFDEEKSHVIPALIMKFHKAVVQNISEISIWGSGTPLREFLYVDDLADACVFLLKNYSDSSHVNIGSGYDISIAKLAEMIAHIVGYKGNIIFDKSKPDGMKRKLMDISKMSSMGWIAKTNLNDGLKKAYEYYLSIEKII